MKKVNIISLGCSKNLVDTELLMKQLEKAGYGVEVDVENSKAKIVVINTCGFIGDAKEESINTILEQVERKQEEVQRLMQSEIPADGSAYLDFARDIFLFSYLSAGINFKDIATLRYCDMDEERIYYARHKTSKEMTCHLSEQSKAIIGKYAKSDHADEDYIFPILDRRIHKTEQQIYDRVRKVLKHVNKALHEWSRLLGLKIELTTYVARHTFATVLKRSGVNIAIISESLGHSDLSTTQIYLDSFENSQIDAAMQNLL